TVYTLELTGDQALVTFRSGDRPIVVKMPKDFEITEGSEAAIAFDPSKACFFSTRSGQRVRAHVRPSSMSAE
ncbi:MAG: hypothetical protein AAFQ66_22675, partial [Pseudomonadota bacterium]